MWKKPPNLDLIVAWKSNSYTYDMDIQTESSSSKQNASKLIPTNIKLWILIRSKGFEK